MSERSAPPPGPPWDLPVSEVPLVFVDLEMTGLDVEKDRVVEVCFERVRGGKVESRIETLVLPEERAGGNAHVHGLDEGALAGAPSFASLAADVEKILEGGILVAHAAQWDASFVEMEMRRAGRPLEIPFFLDTLVLARRAFALQTGYSLGKLCEAFAIDRGRAHRAGSDVRAMRAVFDRCIAELRPVSARDLWEVRIAERRARAAIVAACEAAVEHAAAVQITYRPSHKPPQALLMMLTEVRADLDPPRVIGYQLPGRGRRELRADRILRVDPPP